MSKARITCHCGTVAQVLIICIEDHTPTEIPLCHCSPCRRTTGLLCTSYVPIMQPSKLDGTTRYAFHHADGQEVAAYFCRICGCHIFRQDTTAGGGNNLDGSTAWKVATGVVVGGPGLHAGIVRIGGHHGVHDTRDGGLCLWLDPDKIRSIADHATEHTATDPPVLNVRCHCNRVTFHITRPNPSSSLPKSNFPDLMLPYITTPKETISNPSDAKWWLRPNDRYLAGTCACKSCRLTSGFPIQTWTFVPRANIFFTVPSEKGGSETLPLDFEELRKRGAVLEGYDSSDGVTREFCPGCGATVFWHDKWRPELMDVSVGLLDDESGARAEPWLDWWTGRVSFVEDARNGREGRFADAEADLVSRLESGLKAADAER